MSREIELRFSIRPEDFARLKKAQPRGFAAGPSATRKLSSVYYDTPDFEFAKAGLTLRVRKLGRHYVQTVKDESAGALASDRGEYESKIGSATPDLQNIPDSKTRSQLQSIVDGGRVEPIVETKIRRTTRALKTQSGEHIELALDSGEIRTLANGRAAVTVNEVELELKHGSPIALYQAARRLCHAAPLTITTESKLERGLRVLEGREIGAQKAGKTELAEDCVVEEAFRATLNHCLRHIARNTGAVAEARDPEGIHQIRVGLRRLRAALSAFGDAFRAPALEALRERAKTLADVFGETRELDVFALELLAPIEELSNKPPGLPQLRLALDEIRRECWDRAAELVRSDEFTGFLLDLAVAIESRVWRDGANSEKFDQFLRPARSLAAESLEKCLKKAIRRAREAHRARHRSAPSASHRVEAAALHGRVLRTAVFGQGRQSVPRSAQQIAGPVRHAERCRHRRAYPAPDQRTCGRERRAGARRSGGLCRRLAPEPGRPDMGQGAEALEALHQSQALLARVD